MHTLVIRPSLEGVCSVSGFAAARRVPSDPAAVPLHVPFHANAAGTQP
jgi:hypothetical protein